jgi:hypothetical protein
MNWKFTDLEPRLPMQVHHMTLEGHVVKWARHLAAQRGVALTHVIRGLITEALRHWRKTGDVIAQYPGRETPTKHVGVVLDEPSLAGLREISETTGKSISRVTSEILLDAMISETEFMKMDLIKRKTA